MLDMVEALWLPLVQVLLFGIFSGGCLLGVRRGLRTDDLPGGVLCAIATVPFSCLFLISLYGLGCTVAGLISPR